jgi:thiol:disulfide interchange protein DsbD
MTARLARVPTIPSALPGGSRLLATATALLAAALSAPACADGLPPAEAATEQVRVRLVASVDAVYPGAEILLGLNQRIIPHWHTYWKNPGDSGIATTLAWRLPEGANAGDIRWPVPSLVTLGPIANYAYSDEVTLLSPVRVPKNVKPGSAFEVAATAKWLVCEELCIPQQAELGLKFPVVATAAAAGPGSPLIAAAEASLPVASPWPVAFEAGGEGLQLRVEAPELARAGVSDLRFFPERWGRISHGADQPRESRNGDIVLKLQPGEAPAAAGETLSGVLVVTEQGPEGPVSRGFEIAARIGGPAPAAPRTEEAPALGLPAALLLALLGGAILNLMPCVFPVLSLKALHLVKQTRETRQETRRHGWAYTFGVLASFGLLGGLLIALKAGGAAIGWGFQFQSPLFVLAVAYLMFAVGLNLSGVFTVGGSVAGLGSSLAGRGGYAGSFFTGALATLVAAPCTAPFMGAAVGFALAQPAPVLLAVLGALGLGLALPFLLLTHWPLLQRALPRPGPWMDTLKQLLAFPMYATAVWLVWVLAQQAGTALVPVALGGMVAIAFAAWAYEHSRPLGDLARRAGTGAAAVALLSAAVGGYLGIEAAPANASIAETPPAEKSWQPYSAQRLQELRARGEPVFLNFTAAWCISCLVNERVALGSESVGAAFRRSGIAYLKGDWTHRDPAITEKLAEFGRSGVPLYVFYPPGTGSAPVVLPQILTPDIVLGAIAPASASINPALSLKE